ncbi:SMP-30/gluconolactonase/LRE family protein [Roseateles violae]|uniref:SMP-30/gluconolactonase/LRE family protein n=1 Tax=Roseateles violae TaxID=3058042 RepID=A0ABT8DXG7_9BURK|nr:SMP-30/gluconolactonase/LRE family protein [Pelomonas sp. PFR6]MDN3921301.1 SMP-30/gluconolactonase/LRE family protein [Pelomonas sp. PFR6]
MSWPGVELWWDGPSQLAESPLWSPVERCFFWVDIRARRVWRHEGSARPAAFWQLAQAVGSIALREGGGLIAALEDGVYALDLFEGGRFESRLLAAAPHGPGVRFNDGRCDRQGRFWVGSMDERPGQPRQALGRLARLSRAGETDQPWQPPLKVAMRVPNGLGFSPAGDKLYFSDSDPALARVWVCDYDTERGQARTPQPFIAQLPVGRPDGAAVDAEGGYWICANDGAAVLRYTPDGRLDRRIDLPVAKPTMCAFGGPDMRSLLITSMQGPQAQPLAGALFALRPGVPGLAETPYR